MNTHHGGVDHLDVAIEGLGNRVHDAIPHTRLAPADEAVVTGDIGAIAFRKIAPRRTGAQHPEDAVQNPPVVNTRHAARFVRKKRFDDRPFEVRQIVAPAHVKAPTVWKPESHRERFVNPFYEYMT